MSVKAVRRTLMKLCPGLRSEFGTCEPKLLKRFFSRQRGKPVPSFHFKEIHDGTKQMIMVENFE